MGRNINPNAAADFATLLPIGYDTLGFTLRQEDCPEFDLISEVATMVSANSHTEWDTGYRFTTQGLTFTVNARGVRLTRGNLCRFYRETNKNTPPLTFEELRTALDRLRINLPLPWEKAQVYRVDLTADIPTDQHPSKYFSSIGRMPRFEKQVNGKNGIAFHSSSKYNKAYRTFLLYNKTKHVNLQTDILRFEMRWKRSYLRKNCRPRRVLTLGELTHADTYKYLVGLFMDRFKQLELIEVPWAEPDFSSPRRLANTLAQAGAHFYNYDYLMDQAEMQPNSRSTKSRTKRYVKDIFSQPYATSDSERTDEIRDKMNGTIEMSLFLAE